MANWISVRSGRVVTILAVAAIAISPFLPWIAAGTGRRRTDGATVPLVDLFRGISGDTVGFWRSAGLVLVLAAALVAGGAVAGRRWLMTIGVAAAGAVLIDWVVLEAVHRAPGNTRMGDFRAGAWLLLIGVALATVGVALCRPGAAPPEPHVTASSPGPV